jgi:hypothetical protein
MFGGGKEGEQGLTGNTEHTWPGLPCNIAHAKTPPSLVHHATVLIFIPVDSGVEGQMRLLREQIPAGLDWI